MMKIEVDQKIFELMIGYEELKERIKVIGNQLNDAYACRVPVFIGVLNGSFMFMADLMKELDIACEISFVKLSSYSTGSRDERIEELIGLNVVLKDRDVVIVEDIVDSGNSLQHTITLIDSLQPKSVSVCALLYKPDAVQYQFDNLDYVGFEIANEFVVGYGLDYRGQGRNLRNIYKEVEL